MMTAEPWEFWIDVGGTFTDCFARRPDGTLLRHKLLSSGVTKGIVAAGSTRGANRRSGPLGRSGAILERLATASCSMPSGHSLGNSSVAQFDPAAGRLKLAAPLPVDPARGGRYELSSTAEAPLVAIRYLLSLAADEPVPPVRVRLGTTRGTNALLTRRGAAHGTRHDRGFRRRAGNRLSKPAETVRAGDPQDRLRWRRRRSKSTSGWPPTARSCAGRTWPRSAGNWPN